jgi:hypothetical protein
MFKEGTLTNTGPIKLERSLHNTLDSLIEVSKAFEVMLLKTLRRFGGAFDIEVGIGLSLTF